MLVNQAASDSIESAAWQQGHAVDLPDGSIGSIDAPWQSTTVRSGWRPRPGLLATSKLIIGIKPS